MPTLLLFLFIALFLVCAPTSALAQLNVTNTFVANTPAVASQVNQNFDEVEAAVNANTTAANNAQATANTAQATANNAQGTATNTQNRRGMDYVSSNSTQFLTGGSTTFQGASVTVTVPSAGLVEVDFSSTILVSHTAGSPTTVRCALRTSPGNPDNPTDQLIGSFRQVQVSSTAGTGVYFRSVHSSAVYVAPGTGTVTFYAQCARLVGSGGQLNQHTLRAVYHERRL